MLQLDFILQIIILTFYLGEYFTFVKSLAKTFVPAFAEVKQLPARYGKFLHDLLCLPENVFATHCRVVYNEVGKSDLHLRIEGFATSFLLFYLFCVVPSSNVLGMDSEGPCLLPDQSGETL